MAATVIFGKRSFRLIVEGQGPMKQELEEARPKMMRVKSDEGRTGERKEN